MEEREVKEEESFLHQTQVENYPCLRLGAYAKTRVLSVFHSTC